MRRRVRDKILSACEVVYYRASNAINEADNCVRVIHDSGEVADGTTYRTRMRNLQDAVEKLAVKLGYDVEDEKPAGDEHMGRWVYCSQHARPHRTGWCTVDPIDKVGLHVRDEESAYAKCRHLGLMISGE